MPAEHSLKPEWWTNSKRERAPPRRFQRVVQ
jgi:hypothetical protein